MDVLSRALGVVGDERADRASDGLVCPPRRRLLHRIIGAQVEIVKGVPRESRSESPESRPESRRSLGSVRKLLGGLRKLLGGLRTLLGNGVFLDGVFVCGDSRDGFELSSRSKPYRPIEHALNSGENCASQREESMGGWGDKWDEWKRGIWAA